LKQKLLITLFLGFTLFCFSQNTAIPDANFEQALIDLGIDTDATIDGQVLTANISSLTSLVVDSENIADLTGIEGFTALTYLDCSNNVLTSLDVATNTALTYLNCSNNVLASLDMSTNTALIYLYCFNNVLTSLDVTTNTALKSLGCSTNQLTTLDVRNENNTEITTFNVTTNPNLTCILVDDADWSTTNWMSIDTASTFVNNETECAALSIADNTLELGVSVYPNPTDSKLFIEGNENPLSISIYNLLGKKVLFTENTNKVDVKELSNGVYMIWISDGVRQANRKFVKN